MRSASSRISTVSSRSCGIDAGLQQLRRAANAGQRVLHLMRQDRRHAGDAARGAAERELAIERAGGRGVLQHQQHRAGFLRQRRALHGHALLVQPRAVHRQVVVGDRRVALADLLDQQEQRVVLGNQVAQPKLRQAGGGDAEELLGRVIDEAEAIVRHRAARPAPAARSGSAPMSGARRRSRSASAARVTGLITPPPASDRRRARGSGAGDAAGDQPIVEAVDQPQHRRRHPAAGSPRRGTRPNRAVRASTRTRACARDARRRGRRNGRGST